MMNTLTLLRYALVIVVGFAVLMFLGILPGTRFLLMPMVDAVTWPMDGNPAEFTRETKLLLAISSGLLVGWGVTLWFIAQDAVANRSGAARKAIIYGVICWFVVDSTGSVLSGVPLNALANISFLVILLAPFFIGKRPVVAASRRIEQS